MVKGFLLVFFNKKELANITNKQNSLCDNGDWDKDGEEGAAHNYASNIGDDFAQQRKVL